MEVISSKNLKILIILITLFQTTIFPESLIINDNFKEGSSENYLQYVKDRNFELDDVLKMKLATQKESFLGFQNGVFWTKFSIKNISKESKKFIIYNFLSETDLIEIWIFRNGVFYKKEKTGLSVPRNKTTNFYRLSFVEFTISPNEEIAFISKIKNTFIYNLNWEIIDSSKFRIEESYKKIILGFISGLVILFAFATFFLYFAYNDKTFLFISLFSISTLVFHLSFQGLIYIFDFGISSKQLSIMIWASAILCNLFPLLYSYSFFNIGKKYKRIALLLKISIIYFISIIPVTIYAIYYELPIIYYLSKYSIFISFLIMNFLFFTAIFMFLKKEIGSIYFLIGQGLVSISFFFYNLALFQLFPYTENLQFLMPIVGIIFIFTTLYSQYVKLKYEFKTIREKKDFLLQQSRFSAMGQAIGSISHQWKEPLNTLSISISLLEVSFLYKRKDFKNYFQDEIPILKNSLDLMNKTIDEFSTYYRGKDAPKNFSTTATINNIKSILKTKITTTNTEIFVENRVEYIVSYEHIFSNIVLVLISNSLDEFINFKLDNIENENFISIKIEKIENNFVFHYKDSAGGIKLNPVERVFEYFATTKNTEGMGLPIAKMLIEDRLNGKIKVSNTDIGVYFYIKFPLN
ncbi:7TM-containing protein possibly involved in signal transduction,histidine kinase [Thiovulum sp. ES]|nr:7TM-containing protein possibly involved in signal transduction,histidine kinase [Thiovulum sp. ES]